MTGCGGAGKCRRILAGVLVCTAMFLTLFSTGCGKSSSSSDGESSDTGEVSETRAQIFAENFFNDCNLSYEKLTKTDVANTADEYLFYVDGGVVYRTVNDYVVMIVERSELDETDEQAASNYSGEIYSLFGNNSADVLKYSASGDFAIMCSIYTIPNWDENEVISAFMEYAASYGESGDNL